MSWWNGFAGGILGRSLAARFRAFFIITKLET